ncbi:hypothetical protein JOB18_004112 [Solea senegalensis]|uniref:Uncharacterized protein n=1 Tax=Solea senegalensis TaxID=28829 RepID=A0AAV6SK67_SOLSE|nr:hypothetical protein JOB18_004112 [Solea senegalensis]
MSEAEEQHGVQTLIHKTCFIGLNPTSGTKTAKLVSQRSGKVHEKKNSSVNPHVSSLLRRLIDFEWL